MKTLSKLTTLADCILTKEQLKSILGGKPYDCICKNGFAWRGDYFDHFEARMAAIEICKGHLAYCETPDE